MKKTKIIFIAMAALMLFATVFLTACGNSTFRQPALSTVPDARYAVFSNGGSAVQFGNYVYFVNGHGGFADPNGDANVWREVEKGGLYRARLRGSGVSRTFNFWYGQRQLYVFDANISGHSEMEFYSSSEHIVVYLLDEDGEYVYIDGERQVDHEAPREYIHRVDVERVIGKRIGQEHTVVGGGIFILGEWIFFSSPHNLRDHAGVVQSARTDFFKARLDGSRMYQIYTTVNHRDEANNINPLQYSFYKFNGNYYLVVLDGTEIVSVQMDRGGNRVRSPQTIASDVTSAYFPTRPIYYHGIYENGVENFIYWTRNATANDPITMGNVLISMRPNGAERAMLYNGRGTAQIMGTDNGIFFYSAPVNGITTVHFSDLRNVIYRNTPNVSSVSGSIRLSEFNHMHSLVGIRPNHHGADSIYVLGFGAQGVTLFSRSGAPVHLTHRNAEFIGYNGHSAFVQGIRQNAWSVYEGVTLFLIDGGDLFSINLFDGDNYREIGTAFGGGSASFRVDILPNFIVFFNNAPDVSLRATNYAWFVRLTDRYADPMLVAYIIEDDLMPEIEVEPDNG